MTKKNDIGGIEHEVIILFMQLENTFKHLAHRLSDLVRYNNSGSVGPGELEQLKLVEESTRKGQEEVSTDINKLLTDFFDAEQGPKIRKHSRRDKNQALKLAKERIGTAYSGLQAMQLTLDKVEEKFRMYNVPKRDVHQSSPEPFDGFLERLREFMRVTWKEAAEKCRRKEHRSFIEWMVKLEQSKERETRTTFEVLRGVLTVIGIQISWSLIDYLLIMSFSAEREEIAMSICEVKSIIRCLRVEEKSIVIDIFLSVVELFERAMKLANPYLDETEKVKRSKKIKNDDMQIEKENDVLLVLSCLPNHFPFSDQATDDKGENKIKIKKDDSQIFKDMNGKYEKKTDKAKKNNLQIEKENDVLSVLSSLPNHFPFSDQDTDDKGENKIEIKKDDSQIVKYANGKHEKKTDKVKKDNWQIEKEYDLLHLIIIEVLRLEVGFRFPGLADDGVK
ncbi:hypothetical protein TIFTF001_012594 [Ficus carica]|uniref:Uncharacterized protein n=1 Tax=Ficus carica TaxID=3494 RepID=A0AA88A1Z8_FICCA|nr:hypothetical protein TIFTF001_012594 [Ficus carica]